MYQKKRNVKKRIRPLNVEYLEVRNLLSAVTRDRSYNEYEYQPLNGDSQYSIVGDYSPQFDDDASFGLSVSKNGTTPISIAVSVPGHFAEVHLTVLEGEEEVIWGQTNA